MTFGSANASRPAGITLGRLCGRLCWWAGSLVLSALIVATIGAGLLYARLSAGPIMVPGMAQVLAERISEEAETYEVEIGSVELSLGDGRSPAGIRFLDVASFNPEGDLLMSAPSVAVNLSFADLMQGKVRPRRVILLKPEMQILRAADGRLRFGLGTQSSFSAEAEVSPELRAAQYDAIARIVDGFVGDIEQFQELAELRTILIRNIDLTFRDEILDQTWRTEESDLRIERTGAGATALLNAVVGEDAGSRIPVEVTAARLRGTGVTDISAQFQNLTPKIVSGEMSDMQWTELLDGSISGFANLSLARNGGIENLSGTIETTNGALVLPDGSPKKFDSIALDLDYLPGQQRLAISDISVISPAINLEASGSVDLFRDGDGAFAGLDTRMAVKRLSVAFPDVFAERLSFDGGQIAARTTIADGGRMIAKGFLQDGDLSLSVDGRVAKADGVWVTDLRASGSNVGVDALIALWPKAAAVNARSWIDENVSKGQVDRMITHLRLSDGEPQLNLEFAFSDLEAEYIKGMSHIREARGRGHLTLHDLYLFMDEGYVRPAEGERITLDRSSLVFRDLSGIVTPAEVTLTGNGDLGAILTLIDEQPLGLVSKLDLEPADISGSAAVDALVTFPLLQDLLIEQIFVDVDANLASVRMPFVLGGERLDVAGEAVTIAGSTSEMRISGDLTVDGTPLGLAWTESYGRGANHRQIIASGRLTPVLLQRVGVTLAGFQSGFAVADVTVTQTGEPAYAIELSADLASAVLEAPQIGWRKEQGEVGRLKMTGQFGAEPRIDRIELAAAGLSVLGAATLDAAGDLKSADLEKFVLRDKFDLAVRVFDGDEGLEADLKGRFLNLEPFLDLAEADGEAEGGSALFARFQIDEVRITSEETLRSAGGVIRRNGARIEANGSGTLGGAALTMKFLDDGKAPGSLEIQSEQAGELVDHFGIYEGAQGGNLKLVAAVAPQPGLDVSGLLKIRGLRVSRGDGLKSVLTSGRFAEEQVQEVGGGITFSSIRVPFDFADGELRVGESFAKSPSLAITAQGAVSPKEDKIDLVGVISPAYGLTSAIDDVPLLGSILTGGEGKGVFGMTFAMSGSLANPEISVNPLSLLTPGFLRRVFYGRSEGPDDEFIERLETGADR
ncbi:MAG: AsmA-like C-terminal domain-containing protein [Pseudomonadota bacterium]